MDDDIYYAVLMKVHYLNDDTNMYIPDYLIEGSLIFPEEDSSEDAYFQDDLGEFYVEMSSLDSLERGNNKAVGFPISKTELLKRYPGESLEDAKQYYYGEFKDEIHIGAYSIDDDGNENVEIRSIDVKNLFLEENKSFTTQTIVEKQSVPQQNFNKEVVLQFEKEYLKNLLSLSSEEIKKTLEKFYRHVEDITEEEDGQDVLAQEIHFTEENITGILVSHFFQMFFIRFHDLTKKEEFLELLEKTQEGILEIMCIIDKKKADKNKIFEVLEYLESLYDTLDLISRKDALQDFIDCLTELELKKQDELYQTLPNNIEYILTHEEVEEKEEGLSPELDVLKMKAFLDQRVIGQERAKREVISSIVENALIEDSRNKNSCLLVGPTGSGKTLIAETLGEYLKKPISIFDLTQVTAAGYIGEKVENSLVRLLEQAKGNLEKAQRGILVFEEIDKKGSGSNSDISGKAVLNTLLPFIQGSTYYVRYNGKNVAFNTSQVTFFATGSFAEAVDELSKNRGNKIGFQLEKEEKQEDIDYVELTVDDLVKYGQIPRELAGRMILCQLHGHTKESLIQIMENSDISALLSEQQVFQKLGVRLEWTRGYLEKAAEKALALKVGGRSIKKIVEDSVLEVRWLILSKYFDGKPYKKVLLTEDTILDNKNCILFDQEDREVLLKDVLMPEEKAKVLKK